MRVLLYTTVFPPSHGGIEIVMRLMAEEAAAAGHQVRVATLTPDQGRTFQPAGYEVIRGPSLRELLVHFGWCELVVLGGMTLKGLVPGLLRRRPIVATHHFRYIDERWPATASSRFKRWAACLVDDNISCSEYVARQFAPGVRSFAIPNCYDGRLFTPDPDAAPRRDIVFVGRLVSDKGADVLVEALGILAREQHLRPSVTIVGGGPEADALKQQASGLGLGDTIEFAGSLPSLEVAARLRDHRVAVVPSRWNEPFGIVALEAIASGCVVVASQGGGLPEAIGPCGVTFPNNDAAALAAQLHRVLTQPGLIAQLRSGATDHLARHTREAIGRRYLEAFENVLRRRRGSR